MLFDQVHQQRRGRAVEDPVDEVANHGADDLALGLGRAVNEGYDK